MPLQKGPHHVDKVYFIGKQGILRRQAQAGEKKSQ
jgi:hypothetical protein